MKPTIFYSSGWWVCAVMRRGALWDTQKTYKMYKPTIGYGNTPELSYSNWQQKILGTIS